MPFCLFWSHGTKAVLHLIFIICIPIKVICAHRNSAETETETDLIYAVLPECIVQDVLLLIKRLKLFSGLFKEVNGFDKAYLIYIMILLN